jgi:hypothetical protein
VSIWRGNGNYDRVDLKIVRDEQLVSPKKSGGCRSVCITGFLMLLPTTSDCCNNNNNNNAVSVAAAVIIIVTIIASVLLLVGYGRSVI